MKKSILWMITSASMVFMTGCGPKPCCPNNPAEAAIMERERACMVRGVLYETTPNNMNNLPRALTEFSTLLPSRQCPPTTIVTE